MDWVKPHYTAQSLVFGRSGVSERHREIAALIERVAWMDGGRRRVLELGAGACGVAAAMADRGHDVFAVEFNPADLELAREMNRARRRERLHVIAADFNEVAFRQRFDLVYYWDGFGVGEDDDQRRLLDRIGGEWLAPSGRAVIDVFGPWNWQKRSGKRASFTARDGKRWIRETIFDPVRGRFRDRMHPEGDPARVLSQTIRVYTLQEFLLLAEPTAVAVEGFFLPDGTPIDPGDSRPGPAEALGRSNGYLAVLSRCRPPETGAP